MFNSVKSIILLTTLLITTLTATRVQSSQVKQVYELPANETLLPHNYQVQYDDDADNVQPDDQSSAHPSNSREIGSIEASQYYSMSPKALEDYVYLMLAAQQQQQQRQQRQLQLSNLNFNEHYANYPISTAYEPTGSGEQLAETSAENYISDYSSGVHYPYPISPVDSPYIGSNCLDEQDSLKVSKAQLVDHARLAKGQLKRKVRRKKSKVRSMLLAYSMSKMLDQYHVRNKNHLKKILDVAWNVYRNKMYRGKP